MSESTHLPLFAGYGIELEYMIVDRDSLKILPITDLVMKAAAGEIVSDFEDGDITWSNELVAHVIELKTTAPVSTLANLETSFMRSLEKVNKILATKNAILLPTAMHPFMTPDQMTLWAHENNEVYDAYNRIFDCRGHGWSNLQSMHINLPFSTDEEFEKLHAAIRFLLPIMPALTACSPVVEGKLTPVKDNRLLFYQKNQARVPSIAGQVIPENAKSKSDYHEVILKRIFTDIAPHDPDEILREDWLNSRGAIARFGRQTIEIRILDIQEAPLVDLAIADFISTVLKALVKETKISRSIQTSFSTEELKAIFDATAVDAEMARITNSKYLQAFGIEQPVSAQELWKNIRQNTPNESFMSASHAKTIDQLIASGSLATRIQSALGKDPGAQKIKDLFFSLSECLVSNRMFSPSKTQDHVWANP